MVKNCCFLLLLLKILERDLRLIGPLLQHGIDRDSEKGQYLYIKGMVNAVKTEQAIYQVLHFFEFLFFLPPFKGLSSKRMP